MKIKLYQPLFILLSLFSLGSCMSDSLNMDPDKIMENELEKDNLWGTYLLTMQENVISGVVNDFQRSEDLFGNMYSGYMAGTNNWEGGANGTTYAFPAHWIDTPFKIAYVDFLASWNILRQKEDSTSILFAVGEIVKVVAMHKTCDMYGPLPYKKFGLANPVPYDSQKDIYDSFFKELDHGIDILTRYDQLNPASKALVNFDLIYSSDIPKWIRLANSLKLRLAMRTRFIQEDISKEIAETAVANPYGVMTSNDDNATMTDNSNLVYRFYNPMYNIWHGYDDECMGATMDSYMNGYKDPRLSHYFQANDAGTYRGLRNGHKDANKFKGSKQTSKPNISRDTPYHWQTASEVYFLRAEGAMLGWDMGGTAEELYKEGIKASFALCGIQDASTINSYLADNTNRPIAYQAVSGSQSAPAPSSITIAWKESADEEEKLERIITQKWIAMYPLGQEAWSEFRRTGYPKVFPVIDNLSNGLINDIDQVCRIPFPESEYLGNAPEVEKATKLLGGPDNGGTKLWWDVK